MKKRYPRVTLAKIAAHKSPPKKEGEEKEEVPPKYQSRVERSRKAVMEEFGGVSLEDMGTKRNFKL